MFGRPTSLTTFQLLGLFEHVHAGHVLSVLFADPRTMITASMDCTVSIWNVTNASKSVDLQPKTSLFGHKKPVIALSASRSLSVLLSASSDGLVILWDLNRGELVRVLTKSWTVNVSCSDPFQARLLRIVPQCASINDVTGQVMLCQASELSVWTLNGDLVLRQDVHVEGEDMITACAFFEGHGHEYLERQLLFTGHKRGIVNVSEDAQLKSLQQLTIPLDMESCHSGWIVCFGACQKTASYGSSRV